MSRSLEERVAVHAALADPTRLAIVDALVVSDRSPSELSRRFGVPGNLLAHHLVVLERSGLVRRFSSSADRRRRYVRLLHDAVPGFGSVATALPESVLFVCSRNSARSQLAAVMWKTRTGRRAASAGTDPAEAVHPGAFAAAERAGLELGPQRPCRLADAEPADVVVTVCDRAHEDVGVDASWWHWSVADPATIGTSEAFDAAVADLDRRITAVVAAASRP